jgi:hypothetical protein
MCLNKLIISGPTESLAKFVSNLSLKELVPYEPNADFNEEELKLINWGVSKDITDINIKYDNQDLIIEFISHIDSPIEAFDTIANNYLDLNIKLYFINLYNKLYGEIYWIDGSQEHFYQNEYDNILNIDKDFLNEFRLKEYFSKYNIDFSS